MPMSTRLERFTRKARSEPHARFNALMGQLFDPERLRESFERQHGRKAPRVNGIREEQYDEAGFERVVVSPAATRCRAVTESPVRCM